MKRNGMLKSLQRFEISKEEINENIIGTVIKVVIIFLEKKIIAPIAVIFLSPFIFLEWTKYIGNKIIQKDKTTIICVYSYVLKDKCSKIILNENIERKEI